MKKSTESTLGKKNDITITINKKMTVYSLTFLSLWEEYFATSGSTLKEISSLKWFFIIQEV